MIALTNSKSFVSQSNEDLEEGKQLTTSSRITPRFPFEDPIPSNRT